MKKYYKNFLYFLAILLGMFLFIYGEYDDSPGGQLLGVVIFMIGIVKFMRGE